jgi:hypothetical protein
MCKQLLLRSETRHYAQGSIIADSRDDSRGLLVITSGQVKLHMIDDSFDFFTSLFSKVYFLVLRLVLSVRLEQSCLWTLMMLPMRTKTKMATAFSLSSSEGMYLHILCTSID